MRILYSDHMRTFRSVPILSFRSLVNSESARRARALGYKPSANVRTSGASPAGAAPPTAREHETAWPRTDPSCISRRPSIPPVRPAQPQTLATSASPAFRSAANATTRRSHVKDCHAFRDGPPSFLAAHDFAKRCESCAL